MKTNFYGPKLLIQALLPLFRCSSSITRVLNVSSRLGSLNVPLLLLLLLFFLKMFLHAKQKITFLKLQITFWLNSFLTNLFFSFFLFVKTWPFGHSILAIVVLKWEKWWSRKNLSFYYTFLFSPSPFIIFMYVFLLSTLVSHLWKECEDDGLRFNVVFKFVIWEGVFVNRLYVLVIRCLLNCVCESRRWETQR